MQRELTLLINAKNRADKVLKALERAAHSAAGKVSDAFKRSNRESERSFSGFFRLVQTGFRSMQAAAVKTAAGIKATFRKAAAGIKASMNLGSLLVGGAIAGGIGKAVGSSFEMQRLMANMRAVRTEAERLEIARFAQQQKGGLFRETDILGAFVSGRRLNVQNAKVLIEALRGTAAANGNLAEAVTAVQRAMFEGEAELAERYGLLLREKNLEDAAQRAFRTKVTKLNAEQKAYVVYTETLRQANKLRNIENEMLQTSAGRWAILKNRINDLLLTIGEKLEPVVSAILNLLTNGERFKQFGSLLKNFFVSLAHDIVTLIKYAFQSVVYEARNLIAEVMSILPFGGDWNRIRGTKPTMSLRTGRSVGNFGNFFRDLAAPTGARVPGGGPAAIPTFQQFGGRARPGAMRTPMSIPTVEFNGRRMSTGFVHGLTPGAVPTPMTIPNVTQPRGISYGLDVGRYMEKYNAPPTKTLDPRVTGRSSHVVSQAVQKGIEQQKQYAEAQMRAQMATRDMASAVLSAWDTISARTQTMADDVVGVFANLALTIMQIVQQMQSASAASSLSWLGPIGIGLAGVAALTTVGSMSRDRATSQSVQNAPRYSHAVR